MRPRPLTLFVEGDGDEAALPVLVRRLLKESKATDVLCVDDRLWITGGASRLVTPKAVQDGNWERWLSAARKRKEFFGVLLVADGDLKGIGNQPFCPGRAALDLIRRAKTVGAGHIFSVAVVFACREYESWLIAGVRSLAGRALPGGLTGVRAGVEPPDGDLELHPRDAKGWLSKSIVNGYKETLHQEPLSASVDLKQIRDRNMRSFRRLETSVKMLIEAAKSDRHIVTPDLPAKA